ncbi:CRISPR-associated endonuclease Cas2 [Calditrichota bacterium LG25]
MIYLICYDIADGKRLRRVARFLENQGLRVQKSFFQCDVDAKRMAHIRCEVRKLIDEKEDAFFIYPLCEKCAQRPLSDGSGELLKLEPFEIL